MSLLGSLFNIGASIIGAGSSKKATSAAQAAQTAALQKGVTTLSNQQAQAQAATSPWTTTGASANDALAQLLGLSTPQTSNTDWNAYVAGNPDVAAEWSRVQPTGQFASAADYGKYHYQTYGQNEGRDIAPYTQTTGGQADQQGAIDALKASPLYQSLYGNGEEAVLQNASATGGLRGGNAERSLYNLGTDTLSKVIQQQVSNLGGVSQLGLGAQDSLNNLGAQNAQSIASLFGKQGDVQAGGILQRSAINNNLFNSVAGEAGKIADGGNLFKQIAGLF